MEHRCGTRYGADVDVYVRTRHGAVSSPGRLSEISVSGGFVRTVLPAQPLGYVVVQLLGIEGLHSSGRILEAQVIRRTEHGIAVEWAEYAPQLVRLLVARAGLLQNTCAEGETAQGLEKEA